MNLGDPLLDFLELLGYNAPTMLVLIVCMVLTLAVWKRHPDAARWAFIGFAWLFLIAIISIAWRTLVLPDLFIALDPLEEGLSYVLLSFLESFGYLCFFLAVNAATRPHRMRRYYEDFDEEDTGHVHDKP